MAEVITDYFLAHVSLFNKKRYQIEWDGFFLELATAQR